VGINGMRAERCGTDALDEWRSEQNDHCMQRKGGVPCEDARIPDVLYERIRMLGWETKEVGAERSVETETGRTRRL